jgi:hypothetical protein
MLVAVKYKKEENCSTHNLNKEDYAVHKYWILLAVEKQSTQHAYMTITFISPRLNNGCGCGELRLKKNGLWSRSDKGPKPEQSVALFQRNAQPVIFGSPSIPRTSFGPISRIALVSPFRGGRRGGRGRGRGGSGPTRCCFGGGLCSPLYLRSDRQRLGRLFLVILLRQE